MKKTTRIIALLLCTVMMLGIFAGCQKQDTPPTTTPVAPTTAPTEPAIDYTQAAIKIGYTEDFKYATKGYTVGSGEDAEQVVYLFDLVHEKFPNTSTEVTTFQYLLQ